VSPHEPLGWPCLFCLWLSSSHCMPPDSWDTFPSVPGSAGSQGLVSSVYTGANSRDFFFGRRFVTYHLDTCRQILKLAGPTGSWAPDWVPGPRPILGPKGPIQRSGGLKINHSKKMRAPNVTHIPQSIVGQTQHHTFSVKYKEGYQNVRKSMQTRPLKNNNLLTPHSRALRALRLQQFFAAGLQGP
jgi:hypothetical protein